MRNSRIDLNFEDSSKKKIMVLASKKSNLGLKDSLGFWSLVMNVFSAMSLWYLHDIPTFCVAMIVQDQVFELAVFIWRREVIRQPIITLHYLVALGLAPKNTSLALALKILASNTSLWTTVQVQ